MKSGEYERRRRAIEEQLQADLDLIRAGYQAKLRALEMVWLSSPGGEAPRVLPAGAGVETVPPDSPALETVPETVETVGEAPRVAGRAAPRRVPRRGDLPAAIEEALAGLPAVFDKRDLCRALGYEPSRASLYRALSTLQEEQVIAIETFSDGGNRTRYRKV